MGSKTWYRGGHWSGTRIPGALLNRSYGFALADRLHSFHHLFDLVVRKLINRLVKVLS